MKRKLSAREIAREMANIMVKHLETLPAQECHQKLKAGQKVKRICKNLRPKLYRRPSFASERECVEHLFTLYEKMSAPLKSAMQKKTNAETVKTVE